MTYRLDGYEFGTPYHDVMVVRGGLDPGAVETRAQDVDNPVGDGSWMGRDFFTGPEIGFKLAVVKNTGPGGMSALATLAQAWRADHVRSTPGALSVLQYYRGGQWRRAYGRARKFAAAPKEFTREQVQLVDCTFKVAAPFYEADALQTVRSQLLEPVGDGGVVFPVVFPVEFRPGSQAREGTASVGGLSPAHFQVTIKGPVAGQLSQARVYGPGWSISLTRPLAYDDTVVIDTRRQTVWWNGVSSPGSIGPRDRLDARLSPGDQILGFAGSDPSGTAVATFSWRDTFPL